MRATEDAYSGRRPVRARRPRYRITRSTHAINAASHTRMIMIQRAVAGVYARARRPRYRSTRSTHAINAMQRVYTCD